VRIFFHERVTRQELLGTGLALAGMFWMTSATLMVSKTDFLGDMICFVSMLGYAMYMALGRKNGGRISLWMYMVPLYYLAGVICFVCALFTINPIKAYTLNNILMILGLGIFPTIMGHSILNYSLKHFRGQVVSVAYLGQILVGTGLGFIFLGDVPRPTFYAAAVLIVGGIIIVLNAGQRHVARVKTEIVEETAISE
jgi:drug/metabolite transporter (DMT)-like permease